MLTNYEHYREKEMPIEKLVSFFMTHLKGTEKLHEDVCAINISEEMDKFVSSSFEEQIVTNVEDFKFKISSITIYGNSLYGEDIKKRLLTKYACIKCIKDIRIIQWHQSLIRVFVPNLDALEHYPHKLRAFALSQVPREVFDKMGKSIDEIHGDIEFIEKMLLEEDFTHDIFPLFKWGVHEYYWIFGLDYTTTIQRVKDDAFGCFGEIIGFVIVILIFVLMAKACTS